MFESNWLGIQSQIVNFNRNIESIGLAISSQLDSNILQLLGMPGRILVSPVTQLFTSKWVHFFFQWSNRNAKKYHKAKIEVVLQFCWVRRWNNISFLHLNFYKKSSWEHQWVFLSQWQHINKIQQMPRHIVYQPVKIIISKLCQIII